MDFALETTFDYGFSTWDSTGLPITFAGTPGFEIYEDGGLTQITAGITLTVDHDSVTGAHNLQIAATAANGFEAGKSYAVRCSAGTVDSISQVGRTLFNFTIERSAAKADTGPILVDTGTTIPAAIADVPTVAEFNARTLVAAAYFDPAADTVANVTTVATTTTNTDMRGTDNAALASVLSDHDMSVTGEFSTVNATLASILTDTGTTIPALFVTYGLDHFAALIETDDRFTTVALTNAPSGGGGGDATAANQTTILTRLGTPSDLGGGADLSTNNSDMAGATFSTTTDSQEAIRNRGDAAWVTGVGGTGLTALASGTAQSGTASTIVLAASPVFANNILDNGQINIVTGTGSGQTREITTNTGQTVNIQPNWTTTPDNTSNYEIVQGVPKTVDNIYSKVQGATISVTGAAATSGDDITVTLLYGQEYSDSGNSAGTYDPVEFEIDGTVTDLTNVNASSLKVYGASATELVEVTDFTITDGGLSTQKVLIDFTPAQAQLATANTMTFRLELSWASGNPFSLEGDFVVRSKVPGN